MMLDALLAAGLRLAEALRAENETLIALDLPRAAGLAQSKLHATDAFAAAYAAAMKTNARAAGPMRQTTQDLTARLSQLGTENRRLLERAIAIQSRVIETIAGAAVPRAGSYGSGGRLAQARQMPAVTLTTRA